jgi:pilus assembly protein CpaC
MNSKTQKTSKLRAALLAAFCGVFLAAAGSASAAQVRVLSDATRHAGEFIIPVNKSQVLRLDVPLADLLVGNPEIADVLALTDRSIYVLGKSIGSTSLTLYGQGKTLIAVLDLVVSQDVEGLKARLFELMPEEKIEVRPVNGSLVLSGAVSSPGRLSRALKIAQGYAAGGAITNLLSLKGSQQVMLEVKFSEVSRSLSKDFGFNTNIFEGDFQFSSGDVFLNPDNSGFFAGTESSLLLSPESFGAGAVLGATIGAVGIDLLLEAGENKGLVKILAEPNLIAMSGDTASFLAGGEFPIPVDSEDGLSIEFKEFGVALAFTPTVLDDGLINIVVSPEVSQIDPTLSVSTALGVNVPGLTTRRATTTVEMRDGQSFAIAGLLQSNFSDTVDQYPWLGDIPILGALVRSSGFQQNETELVIIVTPRLVKPAAAGGLAAPSDNFIPPNDFELFLFGRTEAFDSGRGDAGGGHTISAERADPRALSVRGAGGIDGSYGHIIK